MNCAIRHWQSELRCCWEAARRCLALSLGFRRGWQKTDSRASVLKEAAWKLVRVPELAELRSDNPNIGQNLWLLFDFDLPFVEFERRASDDDELLVREWGPLPSGAAVWRVERRPREDAACAIFEAWLARVSEEDFGYDALPARWRERAPYGDACLALTFQTPEASPQVEPWEGGPRYFLRTDGGRIERVGCHDAYERRYALVDRWGRRAFVVNALALRDFRCHVGSPGQQVASCGDPIAGDLSGGRIWFVDDSRPEARAALASEQDR